MILILAACSGGGAKHHAGRIKTIKDGTLLVGTMTDSRPIAYKVGPYMRGFDVELIQAVGYDLGVNVEFKQMDFADLLTAAEKGTVDVVAAEVTDTPEREKTMSFSHPYFVTYMSFVTRKSSTIKSVDQVAHKKVGVVDGTLYAQYVKTMAPTATVVGFADQDKMYAALKAGKVDTTVFDATFVKGTVAADPHLRLAFTQPAKDAQIAFATRKGNKQLIDPINKSLDQLLVDGTWTKLKDQYFGDLPVADALD